jgi:hypothetical protein
VENEMLPEDQQMSEPKWLPNANHHHTSINKKKVLPFASLIRNTLNNLRRKTQDD